MMNTAQSAGAAPHAHDRSSVDRIMLQVCFALLPATGFGFYLFGWPAIFLWAFTCGAALLTEAACLWAQGHPLSRLKDSSALLTGWLLAMSLPPWAPWWIGVGGSVFAIGIGKQVYGGLGQNPFNPAMLARVALLISFPVQMSTWANVNPIGSAMAPGFWDGLAITLGLQEIPDAALGATILGEAKANYTTAIPIGEMLSKEFSFKDAITGFTRGSLGETSEILVLIGGIWLLYKRIITWHIPLAFLLSLAFFSWAAHGVNANRYAEASFHLVSGGVLLGAFFIATDYVTSPASSLGKLIFGAGCGFMVFVIRAWSGFPESVAFGVLFMNALTPLIDRYTKPRFYGRDGRGRPIKNTPALRENS
jgi:electron transport complex protein RnfD